MSEDDEQRTPLDEAAAFGSTVILDLFRRKASGYLSVSAVEQATCVMARCCLSTCCRGVDSMGLPTNVVVDQSWALDSQTQTLDSESEHSR